MKMLAMRLCVTLWCVQQVGVDQIAKQHKANAMCVCYTGVPVQEVGAQKIAMQCHTV